MSIVHLPQNNSACFWDLIWSCACGDKTWSFCHVVSLFCFQICKIRQYYLMFSEAKWKCFLMFSLPWEEDVFSYWKYLCWQTKSSTLKMCLWAVSLTDIKQTTLLLRLIISNLKIFLVNKIFDSKNSPSRRGTSKLHIWTPAVEGGLFSGSSVCAGSWAL